MKLLLASSNPHKIEELRAIFASLATPGSRVIELVGLESLGKTVLEPEEDQPTFAGNAILKARYYAKASGLPCLADDSGLEVDAIGGEPGVISARYAGVTTGGRVTIDPANNRKLLERLAGVPAERRSARFVCTIALVTPWNPVADEGRASRTDADVVALVRGTVEGRILTPEETADPSQAHRGRGTNGFGYDPLFLISALGKTTAELASDEKNKISHRGNAARKMWEKLQTMNADALRG